MLLTQRHRSGLIVAEELRPSSDEDAIDRALKQLDRDLFLVREIDSQTGVWLWRVFHSISDDQPALQVCDWRDEHGRPLPLSWNLVEKIKSQEGRGVDLAKQVDQNNEKLQAAVEAQMDEACEEAATLVARYAHPAHSGGLPRATTGAAAAKRQRRRDAERRAGLR